MIQSLCQRLYEDALTISEISIEELNCSELAIEFGDIFPIEESLKNDNLVPGLRLFSKERSLALAAWFSSLEPVKLQIENQLHLKPQKIISG